MARQLRRCFETELRFMCSVVVLLLGVTAATALWYLFFVGVSLEPPCNGQGECPGDRAKLTWAAVLEIEQRDRDMRATATAEAADQITPTSRPRSDATRERGDDNLYVAIDPCVPLADANDPCTVGQRIESRID